MAEHRLRTPISDEAISEIKAGDTLFLSGTVFTARDEAHMEMLRHNGIPGFDPAGLALYHCGPVMKREGGDWKVVSAGPTTSFRMESLEPEFLEKFRVKVIIGKGGMGPLTLEALKRHNAVYASFTGGAGALAAKGLGKVKKVHYLEELGMAEAVWVFEAKDFGPLAITMDSRGRSLHDEVNRATEANLKRILSGKGLA